VSSPRVGRCHQTTVSIGFIARSLLIIVARPLFGELRSFGGAHVLADCNAIYFTTPIHQTLTHRTCWPYDEEPILNFNIIGHPSFPPADHRRNVRRRYIKSASRSRYYRVAHSDPKSIDWRRDQREREEIQMSIL
jgi:hypothetical protein